MIRNIRPNFLAQKNDNINVDNIDNIDNIDKQIEILNNLKKIILNSNNTTNINTDTAISTAITNDNTAISTAITNDKLNSITLIRVLPNITIRLLMKNPGIFMFEHKKFVYEEVNNLYHVYFDVKSIKKFIDKYDSHQNICIFKIPMVQYGNKISVIINLDVNKILNNKVGDIIDNQYSTKIY
jgi:hypothetical protein